MSDSLYLFQKARDEGRKLEFNDNRIFVPSLGSTIYMLDMQRGETIFMKSNVPFLVPWYSMEYYTENGDSGKEKEVKNLCARLVYSFETPIDHESVCMKEYIAFSPLDDLTRIFLLNGINPVKGFEDMESYLKEKDLLDNRKHKLAYVVSRFFREEERISEMMKHLSRHHPVELDCMLYLEV